MPAYTVRKPRVIVRDDTRVVDPPDHYGLNDELDDGKVILIDPTGIVIRAKPWKRTKYQNFFYPLGLDFAQRVEVNPVEHPQIAAEVDQVLKQAQGAEPPPPDAGGHESENHDVSR